MDVSIASRVGRRARVAIAIALTAAALLAGAAMAGSGQIGKDQAPAAPGDIAWKGSGHPAFQPLLASDGTMKYDFGAIEGL